MRTLSRCTANILAFVYAQFLLPSFPFYSNVGNEQCEPLPVRVEFADRSDIYLNELSWCRQLLSTTRLRILVFTR
jgi:hypothetical protein